MSIDRWGRGGRGAAGTLAAALVAMALVGLVSGPAQAVAIRTSDGLSVPTAGPQVSTAPSATPAAGATPAAATPSPTVTDDWLIVALGLVGAAGFGRGLWLLLRRQIGDQIGELFRTDTKSTR